MSNIFQKNCLKSDKEREIKQPTNLEEIKICNIKKVESNLIILIPVYFIFWSSYHITII